MPLPSLLKLQQLLLQLLQLLQLQQHQPRNPQTLHRQQDQQPETIINICRHLGAGRAEVEEVGRCLDPEEVEGVVIEARLQTTEMVIRRTMLQLRHLQLRLLLRRMGPVNHRMVVVL